MTAHSLGTLKDAAPRSHFMEYPWMLDFCHCKIPNKKCTIPSPSVLEMFHFDDIGKGGASDSQQRAQGQHPRTDDCAPRRGNPTRYISLVLPAPSMKCFQKSQSALADSPLPGPGRGRSCRYDRCPSPAQWPSLSIAILTEVPVSTVG